MMRLPLHLDHAIGEIAAHYHRRMRLLGLLRFGMVLLITLMGLKVSVYLLSDTSIPMGLPVAVCMGITGWAAYKWVYRKPKDKITRLEIARFLDAHHPELEDLMLSSVILSETGGMGASEWMAGQVLERARLLKSSLHWPEGVDVGGLKRLQKMAVGIFGASGIGLLILVIAGDLTVIGGQFFAAPQNAALPFSVEPGHVRVRRGAHQLVWVNTDQASAHKAIQWRTHDGQWQTGVLEPGKADGIYAFYLRDVMENTDYQVQIGKWRSEIYRILVWTSPEVLSIDLAYHYPEYLTMPERRLPNSGDIAAPEGTEVVVDVAVNKPLNHAELVLDSGTTVVLNKIGQTLWQGKLTVADNDHYQVVLRDAEGEKNAYAQRYKIAVQKDKTPEVRIRFPRGDDEATALEEMEFGVQVKDDFGLADYGFQYAISGRDPVRISLKKDRGKIEKAESHYLLSLENLNVSAGDFITWTFWARDGKPGRSDIEGLGDPYFLEVRPFVRFFREAISNEGGQSQSGNQAEAADQKQVMIATWNLRKAASHLSPEEFERQLNTIMEAQRDVQQSALSAAQGSELADGLKKETDAALHELNKATKPDPDGELAKAMRHEQQAYRYMLQLNPAESDVAQSRQEGMGSGGGSAAQRELDGLEISRRRDFREEASTLQTQLEETSQAQNKIRDLAQRQAAINDDIAKLISEMEQMNETEKEEAKRRLSQLQEAQRNTMSALDEISGEIAASDMAADQARQTREQLDEARQQMHRSVQNLSGDQLQQARAAGRQALDALNDVQEQLTHLSRDAASNRMRILQTAMDSLQHHQAQIAEQTKNQQTQQDAPSMPLSDGRVEKLMDQKEALSNAFKQFMEDASDLAEKSGDSQGLMAQKLGDWLRQTSREGIYEDMRDGQQHMQRGDWESAMAHEKEVSARLDSAATALDAVAQYLVRDELDAMEKALSHMEEILSNSARQKNWRPNEARDFAADGYRQWNDALREAEALLPENSEVGRQLSGIREGVWGIGQRYQRDAVTPQYDLLFDTAIKPLQLAAEALREDIRSHRDAYGFSAKEREAVPENYRSHVADYFKKLAEMDGKK